MNKGAAYQKVLEERYRSMLREVGGDTAMFHNDAYKDFLLEKDFPMDFAVKTLHDENGPTGVHLGLFKLINWRGIQNDEFYDYAIENFSDRQLSYYVKPYLDRSKSKVYLNDLKQYFTKNGGNPPHTRTELMQSVVGMLGIGEAEKWLESVSSELQKGTIGENQDSLKKAIQVTNTLLLDFKQSPDKELWLIENSITDDASMGIPFTYINTFANIMIYNHYDTQAFWDRYLLVLGENGGLKEGSDLWWKTYPLRSHFKENVVTKTQQHSSGIRRSPRKESTNRPPSRVVEEVNTASIEKNNQTHGIATYLYILLTVIIMSAGYYILRRHK